MKKIFFIISFLGIFITSNAQEYVESKTFIPGNNANNAIGEKNAIWRNNIIAPPVGNNFPNSQNWWSIFQTQFNDTRYDAQLAFGLNRQDLWLRYNYNGNWKKWKQIILADHNGNVGIGTTNPQEKFQIGNTYTFHDGGHKVIGFLYKPSGGVDLDPLQYSSEIRFDPVNGNFFLGTSNTITSGPTARLSINKIGNIGIGTTNPLAKLDVRGVIKTSHADGRYVNLFTSGDGNSYINITGGSATSRFGFQVDGSSKMSIMKNGNVGIGTADTKGFKLGVAGKIAAEEIKVALYNAWPDYVFEDNHNLPTLQQVENHIAEKGHLENIPSAAEVAKNGIQLGEMNAKLLQKIEELTLYMIEQNKKTENLIKEVAALKQKNAELEQRMK